MNFEKDTKKFLVCRYRTTPELERFEKIDQGSKSLLITGTLVYAMMKCPEDKIVTIFTTRHALFVDQLTMELIKQTEFVPENMGEMCWQ